MIKNRWARRHMMEAFVKFLMMLSFVIVAASLGLILWTIIARGLPSLSWSMITQTPKGGYYMGKEGGVLNAIIGSLYLGLGATRQFCSPVTGMILKVGKENLKAAGGTNGLQ